jgi:hypothetical protein
VTQVTISTAPVDKRAYNTGAIFIPVANIIVERPNTIPMSERVSDNMDSIDFRNTLKA